MTNLRRSRGYGFEHSLVLRCAKTDDWHCRRLGGSSTGLPDLVAVNNLESTLLAIECKSTMKNRYLYVPTDQIERCIAIAKMFGVYEKRYVVFSFKFGRGYKKEFHFCLNEIDLHSGVNGCKIRCDDKGECVSMSGKHKGPTLAYFVMPF